MPLQVSSFPATTPYASPFVGPINHRLHIKVDLSVLTVDEVDADGFLKPGVPFTSAGILVGAGVAVYAVSIEPVKLPLTTVPPTNGTLATETADCFVACATDGVVNRDIAEDNLGRAYTANEIAGFALAGSQMKLTTT